MTNIENEMMEEFELPSKGLGYSSELNIPSVIKLRPIKVAEERLVLQAGNNFNKLVTDILNRCNLSKVDSEKLWSCDRFYLLFMLRAISYGSEYALHYNCKSCNASSVENINLLEGLTIKKLEVEEDLEKTVTLPISKLEVTVKNITGTEEANLLRKSKTNPEEEYYYALLGKIKEIKGQETTTSTFLRIIKGLVGKDSQVLRQAMLELNFGILNNLVGDCPKCGELNKLKLEINESFFGTSTEN